MTDPLANETNGPKPLPHDPPVPGGRPEEPADGAFERLHLLAVLQGLNSRLGDLEDSISRQLKAGAEPRGNAFLETCKIVFGGWPALGFLFLLLFYTPLHDALMSIPDKVRAADEIQVAGVSLKSTIKRVAETQGLENIAETIPALSSPAIELLLRAPRRSETLVSFTNLGDGQRYSAINFPSERIVKALAELDDKGLVQLEGGLGDHQAMDGEGLSRLSAEFRRQLPGTVESQPGDDEVSWKLDTPIMPDAQPLPNLMWTLTERGAQAVDLVLQSVSTALVSADNQKDN